MTDRKQDNNRHRKKSDGVFFCAWQQPEKIPQRADAHCVIIGASGTPEKKRSGNEMNYVHSMPRITIHSTSGYV